MSSRCKAGSRTPAGRPSAARRHRPPKRRSGACSRRRTLPLCRPHTRSRRPPSAAGSDGGGGCEAPRWDRAPPAQWRPSVNCLHLEATLQIYCHFSTLQRALPERQRLPARRWEELGAPRRLEAPPAQRAPRISCLQSERTCRTMRHCPTISAELYLSDSHWKRSEVAGDTRLLRATKKRHLRRKHLFVGACSENTCAWRRRQQISLCRIFTSTAAPTGALTTGTSTWSGVSLKMFRSSAMS